MFRNQDQDNFQSATIELRHQFAVLDGVCFDPEELSLQGRYVDELSAYRARKIWADTLESNFLLDPDHDFAMAIHRIESATFELRCDFVTACARYAFWRLTNNQAPEAQYLIETAHIPDCESRQDEFLTAPDLRSVRDMPLTIRGLAGWPERRGFFSRLRELLCRALDV